MQKPPLCIEATGAAQTRFGEKPLYAEGLYQLGHGMYAWMVPNGSWGESNAGLITGEGESLLVDTLWDVRFTRQMLTAMETVTAVTPITMLVNTHADGDHFFGNQLLLDVDSLTSQASLAEMQYTQPRAMLLLRRIGGLLSLLPGKHNRQAGHWFRGMGAPYHFEEVVHTPARRTFSGELTLYIGGREVQLIEVGPAHTLGDLMVYVPEISRFFGIIITMYYSEHPPPHFHVRYGDHKALVGIETMVLLEGKLPPRVMGMVVEWATSHQDELRQNWRRARTQEVLLKIDPLE